MRLSFQSYAAIGLLICVAWTRGADLGGVVELKGKVQRAEEKTNLEFRTAEGAVYELKRDNMSEALFADTNLHAKILLLKGRVVEDGKGFKVTGNLHSLKAGKRHELFYYCDICAITTSTPGLCLCCRELVELREESAEK